MHRVEFIDRWLAIVGFSLALAALTHALARVPMLARPHGGFAGMQRDRTFAPGSVWEKILRWGGSVTAHLLDRLRIAWPASAVWIARCSTSQARRLAWAGCPGGLSLDEAWFVGAVLTFLGAAAGYQVARSTGTWIWSFPCLGLGALILPLRLRALSAERLVQLKHEFPAIIDLTALAMNAGSDLPAALSKIAARKKGVVADELNQFLSALDLGVTRQSALLALESRCPVDEVRDVVRAILLAEQKGASIVDALAAQARTSRQRRSVKAEESAAKAGVLLMLPMMLLVGCVLILLVGPLICEAQVF